MILVISRFRVINGKEEAVRQAFLDRPHLVDHADGFLGMEVFSEENDMRVFCLVTRWADADSYRKWYASEAHHQSHRNIPNGLKLDPTYTSIMILEPLEASDRLLG